MQIEQRAHKNDRKKSPKIICQVFIQKTHSRLKNKKVIYNKHVETSSKVKLTHL